MLFEMSIYSHFLIMQELCQKVINLLEKCFFITCYVLNHADFIWLYLLGELCFSSLLFPVDN